MTIDMPMVAVAAMAFVGLALFVKALAAFDRSFDDC
jgi:hypothetical protein